MYILYISCHWQRIHISGHHVREQCRAWQAPSCRPLSWIRQVGCVPVFHPRLPRHPLPAFEVPILPRNRHLQDCGLHLRQLGGRLAEVQLLCSEAAVGSAQLRDCTGPDKPVPEHGYLHTWQQDRGCFRFGPPGVQAYDIPREAVETVFSDGCDAVSLGWFDPSSRMVSVVRRFHREDAFLRRVSKLRTWRINCRKSQAGFMPWRSLISTGSTIHSCTVHFRESVVAIDWRIFWFWADRINVALFWVCFVGIHNKRFGVYVWQTLIWIFSCCCIVCAIIDVMSFWEGGVFHIIFLMSCFGIVFFQNEAYRIHKEFKPRRPGSMWSRKRSNPKSNQMLNDGRLRCFRSKKMNFSFRCS